VDYVPTDEIIDALAPQIGKEALKLGIELGLDAFDLERIQNDYQRDLVKETRQVLYEWRNDMTVKATLGVLEQALVNIDRGAMCLQTVVEHIGVEKRHIFRQNDAIGALSKTQDHDLQAKDSKSNVKKVKLRKRPSQKAVSGHHKRKGGEKFSTVFANSNPYLVMNIKCI